jgi:hypothetical protein
VRVEPSTPGSRFLAAHGSLADSIAIRDDFEFSDAEIDAMLDNLSAIRDPRWPS